MSSARKTCVFYRVRHRMTKNSKKCELKLTKSEVDWRMIGVAIAWENWHQEVDDNDMIIIGVFALNLTIIKSK